MFKKIKITFALPEKFQREFREKVVKDNHNLKSKSHWVSEAIERLLRLGDYPDLVKINDEMDHLNKSESIVILASLKKQMDDAIITIRARYPAIEGVQSKIVRTAIMQRLILT